MTTPKEKPAAQKSRGDTQWVQGETQKPVPRQPNERDESADSQRPDNPAAASIGRIAHDDLEEGQVDTDKGPVLDATYDKVKGK